MYKKLSKNATIGVVGVSNSIKRENKESIFLKAIIYNNKCNT